MQQEAVVIWQNVPHSLHKVTIISDQELADYSGEIFVVVVVSAQK